MQETQNSCDMAIASLIATILWSVVFIFVALAKLENWNVNDINYSH